MKLNILIETVESLKVCSAAKFTSRSDIQVVLKNSSKPYDGILDLDCGNKLFSSNSTVLYLMQEEELKWPEWESCVLRPVLTAVGIQVFAKKACDPKLISQLAMLLEKLQDHLKKENFIAGITPGAADIIVASAIFPFTLSCIQQDVFDQLLSFNDWLHRIVALPWFTEAVSVVFPQGLPTHFKNSYLSCSMLSSSAGADEPVSQLQELSIDQKGDVDETSQWSAKEIADAQASWSLTPQDLPKPHPVTHPILPVPGKRNILITSALPYVNNVPHLGNIIGCVLSADVFARFCRLRQYTTLFICGTDEYGTATETKALQEGLAPQQICDKYHKLHSDVYKWFNISFDSFGRTTTQKQTEICQEIFWQLYKNNLILKDSMEQLHCQPCDRFLADRFVEGICPFCSSEGARGDQCDKCGRLINATELKAPRCKLCGRTPDKRMTNHLFLDLPTLSTRLEEKLNECFDIGNWTNNAKVISKAWIHGGLRPRCISRDLHWGTPVPLEGYTEKVFYVWFDAPIGYISMTMSYTDEWKRWWKNPEQVELVQFMAKDNVAFHSIIFPACLLGTGEPWTIVKHLSATEYLNYEDRKFSKSKNVGVFGDHAADTGISADIWRFYLLFLRPESQDSAFNWDDFLLKNNSELLNNLGNFVNRALMFLFNNFDGIVPSMNLLDEDYLLLASVNREIAVYLHCLENLKLRDGLRCILSISRIGNQYMQANKPWVLIKEGESSRKRAGSVVGLMSNIAALISVLLQPYMPETASEIQKQLNVPVDINVLSERMVNLLPVGHSINKPSPLFKKIEKVSIEEFKKKYGGSEENKVENKMKNKSGCSVSDLATIETLDQRVKQQGEAVRKLKADKADKELIAAAVQELLSLKKELAKASGTSDDDSKVKKQKQKK